MTFALSTILKTAIHSLLLTSIFLLADAETKVTMRHSAISFKKREELDRINRRDSEIISEEFAVLHIATQMYLKQINCDVSTLLACVMDVRVVKEAKKMIALDELKCASTVGSIFVTLIDMNLISYLQFTVVERVISVLCIGSEHLLHSLQQYKLHFNQYIMRRVCDSTVYRAEKIEIMTESVAKDAVELVIITDHQWDECTQFVNVLELKDIIAHALNIDDFNLELLSITPQCLKLYLGIAVAVAISIFPLTAEEWNKLSSLGIIEMRCLSFVYKKG